MRIYEFAQQKNISSKDVVEKLQQNGFEAKSHMSVLDEKTIAFLEKTFEMLQKNEHVQMNPLKNTQPMNVIEKTVPESLAISPKKLNEKKAIESKKETLSANSSVLVLNQMSIGEFSEKTKKSVTDVIINLLKWGIVATRKQIISEDLVKRLASHY